VISRNIPPLKPKLCRSLPWIREVRVFSIPKFKALKDAWELPY